MASAGARPALEGRRVLVMRHDRLGDLVLALPLVEALWRQGARVGLLVSASAEPLLKGDRRLERLIIDGPDALERIREARFDDALVLWANARNALLALRAGVPRRWGPSWRPYSALFNRRLPLRRGRGWTRESEWNLEYGRALGCPAAESPPPRVHPGPEAESEAAAWLRARGPKGPGPLVLLHPGSGGSAQPWPAERFGALGLELARRHKARLVVTAGPADADAARTCLAAAGERATPCAGLSLPGFAALLARADLFAAGSTGPLHLAAAQGTPVLGLYPPLRAMSALRWGPLGSRRAVLSPAGLGFRMPARPGVNYLERVSVGEAAAACGFLLRRRRGDAKGRRP